MLHYSTCSRSGDGGIEKSEICVRKRKVKYRRRKEDPVELWEIQESLGRGEFVEVLSGGEIT